MMLYIAIEERERESHRLPLPPSRCARKCSIYVGKKKDVVVMERPYSLPISCKTKAKREEGKKKEGKVIRSSCHASSLIGSKAAAVWRLLVRTLGQEGRRKAPYGTGTAPQYDTLLWFCMR